MSKARTPLTVVFNGSDLPSAIEVKAMKKKDKSGALELVDIVAGGNPADYDIDEASARKTIQIRDAAGRQFSGIDAIGAMHEAVGLGGYFRFCRVPGLISGSIGLLQARKAA